MKQTYIKPESELIDSIVETLLATESIGVKSEDIDDPLEVQSKQAGFVIDDDETD